MALRSVVRIALVLTLLSVHLFATSAGPAMAQGSTETAPRAQQRLAGKGLLTSALKAIMSVQDANGGIASLYNPVDPRFTASAVGLMIALQNVEIDVDMDAAVAYLQTTDPIAWAEAEGVSVTPGEIGRIVMALVAAGGDPRDVGGNDLIAELTDSWHADTGIYGTYLVETPFVVMALALAGETIEENVFETFSATRLDDGSWDLVGGEGPGDGRTTALIVQTLVATGRGDDPMVEDAVAFFHTLQNADGAFATAVGREPDSYTSGLIVSAIIAAGEKPKAKEWGKAVASVVAFQMENGWFMGSKLDPYENIEGTIAACIALAGAYLPVVPSST